MQRNNKYKSIHSDVCKFSGTFSSVYVAKLKDKYDVSETFALKHILPTSHPTRIESELRCLKEIGSVSGMGHFKKWGREDSAEFSILIMGKLNHH